VFASAIGGIPEYVDDGDTGLLFPPGDHAQLAARVRHLRDQPAAFEHMRRRARAVAVARFSVAGRIQDYLDLYRLAT
jgi:glycosyltransferase involved in cell wall biosynthesis